MARLCRFSTLTRYALMSGTAVSCGEEYKTWQRTIAQETEPISLPASAAPEAKSYRV